jgi:hypothetical protein
VGEISADAVKRIRLAGATIVDPLPHVINQVGSTCGIYALDTALRIRGIKAPPPRKQSAPPPAPARVGAPGPSMRRIAKETGLTKVGELFDVSDVLTLAALSGALRAAIHPFATAADLWSIVTDAVGGKGSVMFAFCVDNTVANDSKPKTDGKNPHWCLLIGCHGDAAGRRVIATQYGKFYDWSMDRLVASNLALQKWDAQEWGKLHLSEFVHGAWTTRYRGWSNKTSPPAWLAKWEAAAKANPQLVRVEWEKVAAFNEVNFALTLRAQCVVI